MKLAFDSDAAVANTLSSHPDTDAGERAIEAAVVSFTCIDASIDGAKEHVGAIAEADFRVGVTPRHARETTQIGNEYLPAAGRCSGMLINWMPGKGVKATVRYSLICRLMMNVCPLASEQDRSVYAPVE